MGGDGVEELHSIQISLHSVAILHRSNQSSDSSL